MIEIANILIKIDNLSFFEKKIFVLLYFVLNGYKYGKKIYLFEYFAGIFVYQISIFYLCDYLFITYLKI